MPSIRGSHTLGLACRTARLESIHNHCEFEFVVSVNGTHCSSRSDCEKDLGSFLSASFFPSRVGS